MSEAHECFQTLRALGFAVGMKPLLDAHRDKLKPEVMEHREKKGLSLDVSAIAKAEMQRAAMFRRTLAFFETYDLLLCPATIVPPYPSSSAMCPNAPASIRQLYPVAGDRLCDHQCRLPGDLDPPAVSRAKRFPSASRSWPRRGPRRA